MRMALAAAAVIALVGCGTSGGASQTSVVAAFYPLAWAAQLVGGPSVEVTNLTPSGAEPHDIELTPGETARLQKADVVLYVSHGFQPGVERAIRGASGQRVDVLEGIALRSGSGDEAGEVDPHVWLDPGLYA